MRTVKAVYSAFRDDIGRLITRRPLPGQEIDYLDPFLFLNHHGPQTYEPDNDGLPFGPHPHRGFETVTFILEGSLAHQDTGGHECVIDAGGVQWMTAGSGLMHSEVSPAKFKETGGALEILQLWINLPARLKMTQPNYSGMQKSRIPAITLDNGKGSLELIAGEYAGKKGPHDSLTGVFMSVVRLTEGAKVNLRAAAARTVFLYVVKGTISICDYKINKWHLAEMSNEGDQINITALDDAVLLFGHAEPFNEPVVSRGPFVMNTLHEIEQAFADYRSGAFNKNATLI